MRLAGQAKVGYYPTPDVVAQRIGRAQWSTAVVPKAPAGRFPAVAEQGVRHFDYHFSDAHNFAETNEKMIAPWRKVGGEEVLAALFRAEEEFLETVRRLSDEALARRAIIPYYESLERSVAEIVAAKDRDARKHLAGLWAWRTRQANASSEPG